jgi:ABC-type glycerol-3-phosphate transport system permease component
MDVPLWILGMLASVIWVAPFVWMISTSLKPANQIVSPRVEWFPRTIVWDHYVEVFKHPALQWAINSLIVTLVTTTIGVVFAAMAGYALARLRFPGRGLLFGLLLASLMIPNEISVVPLYISFLTVGLTDNYAAIALPSIASVITVYIFRQFFLSLPKEIEDAAAIDGAGRFRTFFGVALPLARAPLLASTILLLITNWNNYLWPSLIIFTEEMKTMPVGFAAFSPAVGTYTQYETFGPAMAAITLLSVPSLVAFVLLQRYFIEGVTRSGIQG